MNAAKKGQTVSTRQFHHRSISISAGALALCLFAGCGHGTRERSGVPSLLGMGNDPLVLKDRQKSALRMAYAHSLETKNRWSEAKAVYAEILQADSRHVGASNGLAIALDREGRHRDSERHHLQALKFEPKNADLHCDYGYGLYLQGRWREAEHHLRRAITLRDDHERAHNNLGLLLARTNHRDLALAEFAQAGCTQAQAYMNLGFAVTLDGEYEEARRTYRLAARMNPSSRAIPTRIQELDRLAEKLHARSAPEPEATELHLVDWVDHPTEK